MRRCRACRNSPFAKGYNHPGMSSRDPGLQNTQNTTATSFRLTTSAFGQPPVFPSIRSLRPLCNFLLQRRTRLRNLFPTFSSASRSGARHDPGILPAWSGRADLSGLEMSTTQAGPSSLGNSIFTINRTRILVVLSLILTSVPTASEGGGAGRG